MIRLLYEVFFEVTLCLMISYTAIDFSAGEPGDGEEFEWGLTLGVTAMALIGLCLLSYLCFRNGPYVKGTYEKRSLKKSFWHYRGIRMDLLTLSKFKHEQKD